MDGAPAGRDWAPGRVGAPMSPPNHLVPQLKLPTEESVSELPMNEIEAWKAAEKVGAHSHPWSVSGMGRAVPPGLADRLFPQKARWVLLVLILAVVGFGALMTQLFLWEYSDLHLFGANQPPAPCYDPCE